MRRCSYLSGTNYVRHLRHGYLFAGIRFILPSGHYNGHLHTQQRDGLYLYGDGAGYAATLYHLPGQCHCAKLSGNERRSRQLPGSSSYG